MLKVTHHVFATCNFIKVAYYITYNCYANAAAAYIWLSGYHLL